MMFLKEDGITRWSAFLDHVHLVCEKCGERINQVTYSSDPRGADFSDLYVYCTRCKEYYHWKREEIKVRLYADAVSLAKGEAYVNKDYEVVRKEGRS
jgi:hypothetical protein